MQEMEEKLADVKQEQVQEQKRLCEQLEAANRENREMQEKLNAAFCAQVCACVFFRPRARVRFMCS